MLSLIAVFFVFIVVVVAFFWLSVAIMSFFFFAFPQMLRNSSIDRQEFSRPLSAWFKTNGRTDIVLQ